MKFKTVTVAAVGSVLLASPALAATPSYTVTVGNAATGKHAVTAAKTSTDSFNYKFGNINEACSNLTATFTVSAGTGVNPIATSPGLNLVGCSINATSTTRQWNAQPAFIATGPATSGSDSIAGRIGNVDFTERWGSLCTFRLVGSAAATFNEATQRLVIDERSSTTGNLQITEIRGCGGTISVGQRATLQATLAMTSPDGRIGLS